MPRRLLPDCETNGLYFDAHTIHCLWLRDVDTGEAMGFADQPGHEPIAVGLEKLDTADEVVGHNIIPFDLPVLRKVRGFQLRPNVKKTDTLVLSRLIYSNLMDRDWRMLRSGKLKEDTFKVWDGTKGSYVSAVGRHSLGAWGVRLGHHKGDFHGPWEAWTPEMHNYCGNDTFVNLELFKVQAPQAAQIPDAVEMEMIVAEDCAEIYINGFPFDEKAAISLYAELSQKRADHTLKVRETFGEFYQPGDLFTPKVDSKRYNYTAGCQMTKVELVEFNPNSNHHVAAKLKKVYGWTPHEFTDKGAPSMTEEVLEALPYPEAKVINDYRVIQKRISLLAEGDKALLPNCVNGHVHGSINPSGAITHRATHSIVANIPKVSEKVPYGKELRSLFLGSPRG